MLEDLAAVSPRIALTVHDIEADEATAQKLGVDKIPAIVLRGQTNRPLRFFGIPSGNQFPVFVETLIAAATGLVELEPETVRSLRKLRNDVSVQVFVTPTCNFSPAMAFNAFRFGAAERPRQGRRRRRDALPRAAAAHRHPCRAP